LYLQDSNDLSKSGRDRPSLPEVFKTVGSAWVVALRQQNAEPEQSPG
jgi:hypothetical protein